MKFSSEDLMSEFQRICLNCSFFSRLLKRIPNNFDKLFSYKNASQNYKLCFLLGLNSFYGSRLQFIFTESEVFLYLWRNIEVFQMPKEIFISFSRKLFLISRSIYVMCKYFYFQHFASRITTDLKTSPTPFFKNMILIWTTTFSIARETRVILHHLGFPEKNRSFKN